MATRLICLQCVLKAFVQGVAPPDPIEETGLEHVQRCHPDAAETTRERAELMAKALTMIPPPADEPGVEYDREAHRAWLHRFVTSRHSMN